MVQRFSLRRQLSKVGQFSGVSYRELCLASSGLPFLMGLYVKPAFL